jgi:hypothetical protein
MSHPRDSEHVIWIADLAVSTLLLFRDQRAVDAVREGRREL